jgi:type II secretory pathway pseudopilin PulG
MRMTAIRRHKEGAFTSVELVVVVVIIGLLLIVALPALFPSPRHRYSSRGDCFNNLKQIGIAYRLWDNDNGGKYPASASITNGGWSEFLAARNAGAVGWTNYSIMQNELGQSPKVLICPADERKPATNINGLNNSHISYFIGTQAKDTFPQSILAGDRNLGPGTVPDPGYGYSPADGKGNDVVITGPVCWSLKMHSAGNSVGAGNILLADGSAQQVSSKSFNENWLKPELNQSTATNAPGIRLIFP